MKVDRKIIFPIFLVALAFSHDLKNATTWLYPYIVMSFTVILWFGSRLRKSKSKGNNSSEKATQYIFKYALIPYVVITIYSIIIILVMRTGIAVLKRSLGCCASIIAVIIISASIVYLYHEKSIIIICDGLLLEYFIEIVKAIFEIGFKGLFIHILDPLNTYTVYFESHDIAFALFLFLIYFILENHSKYLKRILLILFVEYMVMKRIGFLGIGCALIGVWLMSKINKKGGEKRYKVAFFSLFLISVFYLGFSCSPKFTVFMGSRGILIRSILVDTVKDYYALSPRYMGNGYGFTTYIMRNVNILGNYGQAALHNEILRDYIELGFWGFIIAYFYLFVWMPLKLYLKMDKRSISIVFALMIYILITLFTDNTFQYITITSSLMVILCNIKVRPSLLYYAK